LESRSSFLQFNPPEHEEYTNLSPEQTELKRVLLAEPEILACKDDIRHYFRPWEISAFIIGVGEEGLESVKQRLLKNLEYRKKVGWLELADFTCKKEQEILSYLPFYTCGMDKQGHPIVYFEIGNAKMGMVKEHLDTFIKLLCRNVIRDASAKKHISKKINKLCSQEILILNLKGASVSDAWTYWNTIMALSDCIHSTKIETAYKIILVNSGMLVSTVFSAMKKTPFLDQRTADKIFFKTSSYLSFLKEYIDLDQIHPNYGGTSTLEAKLGDVVLPKKFGIFTCNGNCIEEWGKHAFEKVPLGGFEA